MHLIAIVRFGSVGWYWPNRCWINYFLYHYVSATEADVLTTYGWWCDHFDPNKMKNPVVQSSTEGLLCSVNYEYILAWYKPQNFHQHYCSGSIASVRTRIFSINSVWTKIVFCSSNPFGPISTSTMDKARSESELWPWFLIIGKQANRRGGRLSTIATRLQTLVTTCIQLDHSFGNQGYLEITELLSNNDYRQIIQVILHVLFHYISTNAFWNKRSDPWFVSFHNFCVDEMLDSSSNGSNEMGPLTDHY